MEICTRSDIEKILKKHEQKYKYSCTPSSVEMVLKLEGKVAEDYYELQNLFFKDSVKKENCDRHNFCFYEGEQQGLIFKKLEFVETPSTNQFRFEFIFDTIKSNIDDKHFVIIALKSDNFNFHNHVIYGYEEGLIKSVTKYHGSDKFEFREDVIDKIKERKPYIDIFVYEKK